MKVCVASGAADPCPPAVSSNKSRAVIDLTTSPPHHLTTPCPVSTAGRPPPSPLTTTTDQSNVFISRTSYNFSFCQNCVFENIFTESVMTKS